MRALKYLVATAVASGILAFSGGTAQALTCGGQSANRPLPVDCIVTKNIPGVGSVTATLTVTEAGGAVIAYSFPANDGTLGVQTNAHIGISSTPGEPNQAVAEVPAGATTATLNVQIPASDDCVSQVDVKIAPIQVFQGDLTRHIPGLFRVMGPTVQTPNCVTQVTTTTTPQTVVTVPGETTTTAAIGTQTTVQPRTTVPAGTRLADSDRFGVAWLLAIVATLVALGVIVGKLAKLRAQRTD